MDTTSRARIEAEIAHLREVELPRLRSALADAGRSDPADLAQRSEWEFEMEGAKHRLEALLRLLAAPAVAASRDGTVRVGETVVLDFGDGARPYLLAELAEADADVVTAQSPLGRALIGARAGMRVHYQTPRGPADVVVVGLAEPSSAA